MTGQLLLGYGEAGYHLNPFLLSYGCHRDGNILRIFYVHIVDWGCKY